MFCAIAVLLSCGGGGGDGGTAATTYSLSQVKNLTPGYTKTYSLTGSDSDGASFEATITVTIKPPSTINTKSVTPVESIFNSKNITSGATDTGTTTAYYSAGYVLELLERGGGAINCTPTSYTALPDSASIGQTGTIGVIACTDGTIETGTWRLEASGNNAKYIETYANRQIAGDLNHTEDDGYIINVNGDIFGLEITYAEPSGYSVNLSGQ